MKATKQIRAKSKAAAAAAVSSPSTTTVNAVLEWLNGQFGWQIPLLPLDGWPSAVKALWNFTVTTPFPGPGTPYPWVFEVPGDWPQILPPGSKVKISAIKITVTHTTGSPPAHPPVI